LIKTFSHFRRKGEVKVNIHALLTSVLDRDERSASHPGRVTPRIHWVTQTLPVSTGSPCFALVCFTPFSFNAFFFFGDEGTRSRCYGRTAALRLIVQPCDEDEEKDD
jgi:hypothetical protein